MSALTTDYIVNNGNYANQDLSEIFAPIGTEPVVSADYDSGTWAIYVNSGWGSVATTNYYNFSVQGTDNIAGDFTGGPSFINTSNNGLVTTGITNSIASYLEVTKPGLYTFSFTFRFLTQGNNPADGRTIPIQIRLASTTSSSQPPATTQTTTPFFSISNALSIMCNGWNTIDNLYTLVKFYYTSDTDASSVRYPYAVMNGRINDAGLVYTNLYNMVASFRLTSADFTDGTFRLYPQILYSDTATRTLSTGWNYEGNWSLTRVAD